MGPLLEYSRLATLKIADRYQFFSHVEEGKKKTVEVILKAFDTVPTLVIFEYVGSDTTKMVCREDVFEINTEQVK